MKIVIFSNGIPNSKYPENGRFVFEQAKEISKIHDVVYAFLDLRSIRRFRKLGYYKSNMPFDILGLNVPLGKIPNFLMDKVAPFFAWLLISKLNKYYDYDLFHSQFLLNGYYAVSNFDLIEAPIVHTEHLSAINEIKITQRIRKISDFTFSRVNKLITVSHNLKYIIEKEFGFKATYIPNLIEFNEFIGERIVREDDYFNFVSTGRLVPNKGFSKLIKLFTEFNKSKPNSRLTIIGDGVQKKHLKNLVNDYNLSGKINIVGKIHRHKLIEIYNKSDCFILLSQHETFGVVYVEALAAGLPCIATKTGEAKSLINNSNGIIVDYNNDDEILNSMHNIFINKKNYDSTKISKEVRINYSKNKFLNSIDLIYKEIISKKE